MTDTHYWDAESAAKRMDELESSLAIAKQQIFELRARNNGLFSNLTNERIARFAAEAERNAETTRCAKIASDYGMSPVVGKAIAALILA